MAKKEKLQELLKKLEALQKGVPTDDISGVTNDLIENEIAAITSRLKENPTLRTLSKFTNELNKFKRDFNLQPIIDSIKGLQNEVRQSEKDLLDEIETRIRAIKPPDFSSAILALRSEIENKLSVIEDSLGTDDIRSSIELIQLQFQDFVASDLEEDKRVRDDIDKKISALRIDINNRLANLGGGQANRQINVKSSVMSLKYTDINFQNTTTIGWTAVDDDALKRVNIRASILTGVGGGGGSLTVKEADGTPTVASVTTIVVSNGTMTDDGGGQVTITTGGGSTGITRVASVITANTLAGNSSSTDYVFIASAGLSFTLPDAGGNSNLYTLKNATSSSVLVTAVGGDTIDGSSSVLVAISNQTLGFISDGTNYQII